MSENKRFKFEWTGAGVLTIIDTTINEKILALRNFMYGKGHYKATTSGGGYYYSEEPYAEIKVVIWNDKKTNNNKTY